jgi:hypothetical protein
VIANVGTLMGPNSRGTGGSFTPASVSGLVLWLDANDPSNTGVQPADGSPLDNWVDRSFLAYTASATGAERPTYVANSQNGLPTLSFDGTQQAMSIASFTTNAKSSIFFAAKNPTNADGVMFMEMSPDAGANDGFWIFTTNGYHVRNIGSSAGTSAGSAWMGSAFALFDCTFGSEGVPNLLLDKNGVNLSTANGSGIINGSITTSLNIAARNIGGFFFPGTIGEILIYNRGVSNAEKAELLDYLGTKWGV